jgi:arsenate reductase
MAEGWAKALKSDRFEAYSAGTLAHGLNPNAVKVMSEVGVDISGHHSKTVDDIKDLELDYVVTVCGNAHETCPVFLGGDEEEALGHYRRVRDEIKAFVETLPEALSSE